MLRPGDTLGRYTLRHSLGTGSFAEVWRATDRTPGFETEVALKILRPERDDDVSLAGLFKEAALCAALDHPNIVDVRRVELLDEQVLVVMELVEGGTLGDLVARAAAQGLDLPASVVADIGIDIARGLEHAWSGLRQDGATFRVVHRDLKPANVLIGNAGEAKIADFGMAKARGDVSATAIGSLKGTPCYIAPESWQGGREFRPTVDLFAVGCILFELLTGRRLFEAETLVGIFSQATAGVPSLEVEPIRRSHPAFAPVIEALLQRDPRARTQSAAELMGQLQAIRNELGPGGDVSTFLAALDTIEGGPEQTLLRLPRSSDPAWLAVAARRAEVSSASPRGQAVIAMSPTLTVADVMATTGEASPDITLEPASSITVAVPPALARREPGSTRLVPVRRQQNAARVAWIGAAVGGILLIAAAWMLVRPAPPEPVAQPLLATPSVVADLAAPAEPDPPDGHIAADLQKPPASASSPVADRVLPPMETPPVEEANDAAPVPPINFADVSEEPAPIAPPPTAAPTVPKETDACLVLESAPLGGRVWLNSVLRAGPASRARGGGERVAPGEVWVQMGPSSEPTVGINARLEAGVATTVRCDLSVAGKCIVRTSDFGPCQ